MADQIVVPGESRSPALALVNSRHAGPAGWVDHVDTPDDVASWLRRRGLIGAGVAVAWPDVLAVRDLRDAVRELLTARIEGRRPREDAIAQVNATARLSSAAPALEWDDEHARPSRRWLAAPGAPPLATALATIAGDAIDLAAGDRGENLIACEHPRCVRLLVKDHPRRHWCSARCGERIRSARYYARHNKAGTSGKTR